MKGEAVNANIVIDPIYNWKMKCHGQFAIHYIGRDKTLDDFLTLLPVEGLPDLGSLRTGMLHLKGNFSAIIVASNWILAIVDKIRSYPVFYVEQEKTLHVSNSARKLRSERNLTEIDELSQLECRMAGYVTGRETLYKHLY